MKFRKIFITAFIAGMILITSIASAGRVDERIYIVPAGDVNVKVIEALKARIPEPLMMVAKVEVLQSQTIPNQSYEPSRHQYMAEMVLGDVSANINLDEGVESALIVMDGDIYSQDTDFVFGIMRKPRPVALISLARLKNEFYGLAPDEKLFLDRSVKEALYQLGLAWGLEPCPNQKCIMHTAKNVSDIDKKSGRFCVECKKNMQKRYTSPLIKKNILDKLAI
ncbi:MAG: hypothetical protein WCY36_01935 [Candidatus Omnitrophota bacterium]